jgi:hypothetical protein
VGPNRVGDDVDTERGEVGIDLVVVLQVEQDEIVAPRHCRGQAVDQPFPAVARGTGGREWAHQ